MDKNKSEMLTEYEKEVMQMMFSDGFAYDDLDSHFVTWSVEGKRARGAVADMVKKGVLAVVDGDDGRAVYIVEPWTKREVMALCDIPEDIMQLLAKLRERRQNG